MATFEELMQNYQGLGEGGYIHTPGLATALSSAHGAPGGDRAAGVLDSANQFNNLFKQLVGRDPSKDEANSFYQTTLARMPWEYGDAGSQQSMALRDTATNFIQDNFGNLIEQRAQNELQGQQQEANRLADLFRTQGNTAINGVEQSLMDYQSKLFERLRPNLITSLQQQGLLNTGGLNEALAGQQADLARDAGQQVADLRYQNEQGANQIAFGGASAPYEFQKAQTMNRVPYLQQQAQTSMGNLFQQRFADQQFRNQYELLNRQAQIQRDSQPSFLKNLSQNFGTSLGTSVGSNLGKWFGPSGATSAATAGAV